MSVVKNKLKIPLRVSSHLHPLLIQKNHVPYLYCKTQKQESRVSCDKLYSLNGAELWVCHLHTKNDFEALAQNTMCSYYFFFIVYRTTPVSQKKCTWLEKHILFKKMFPIDVSTIGFFFYYYQVEIQYSD